MPEFPLPPSFLTPKTDYAHQARQTYKTHAWKRPETTRFLRAQAHALQRHPEAAAAKLTEAQ